MYNAISRAADNISPFFVVSFCRHLENSDHFRNGLLSQWRGYANGGGFAIEFDEDRLDQQKNIEMDQFEYLMTKTDDVLYENYSSLFDGKAYEGVAGGLIYKVFQAQKKDTSSITGKKDVSDIVFDYVKVAPFLKHASFKEEQEYRLVAACNRIGKMIDGKMKPPKEIKFRSRNSLIIPYIELFKTVEELLPIKSIIVGPHPYQEKQAEAVRMALEMKRMDAEVRLSAIPFRQ